MLKDRGREYSEAEHYRRGENRVELSGFRGRERLDMIPWHYLQILRVNESLPPLDTTFGRVQHTP